MCYYSPDHFKPESKYTLAGFLEIIAVFSCLGLLFAGLYSLVDFNHKVQWATACSEHEALEWPNPSIKAVCIDVFPEAAKARGLTK